MALRIGVVSFCYGNAAGVIEGLNSIDIRGGRIVSWTIVDDGSPDPANREMLRDWAASRGDKVTLLLHEQNAGLVVRMNEVLDTLDCDYVQGCADDVFLPGALDKMIGVAEAYDCPDVVTGVAQSYNEDLTKPMAAYWGALEEEAEYPLLKEMGSLRSRMYRANIVCAPATMWKLSSLKAWGGYDTDFSFEDWPLLMKVCFKYPRSRAVFLSDVVVKYRRLGESSSAVSPAKLKWRETLELEKVLLRLKYGDSRSRNDREIAYEQLSLLRWRNDVHKKRARSHSAVVKWFPVSRLFAYRTKGKTFALGPIIANWEGVFMRTWSRIF